MGYGPSYSTRWSPTSLLPYTGAARAVRRQYTLQLGLEMVRPVRGGSKLFEPRTAPHRTATSLFENRTATEPRRFWLRIILTDPRLHNFAKYFLFRSHNSLIHPRYLQWFNTVLVPGQTNLYFSSKIAPIQHVNNWHTLQYNVFGIQSTSLHGSEGWHVFLLWVRVENTSYGACGRKYIIKSRIPGSRISKNTALFQIKYIHHRIVDVCCVCRTAGSTRNLEGRFYSSLNREAVLYCRYQEPPLRGAGRGGSRFLRVHLEAYSMTITPHFFSWAYTFKAEINSPANQTTCRILISHDSSDKWAHVGRNKPMWDATTKYSATRVDLSGSGLGGARVSVPFGLPSALPTPLPDVGALHRKGLSHRTGRFHQIHLLHTLRSYSHHTICGHSQNPSNLVSPRRPKPIEPLKNRISLILRVNTALLVRPYAVVSN